MLTFTPSDIRWIVFWISLFLLVGGYLVPVFMIVGYLRRIAKALESAADQQPPVT